jgi:hypothetical protein
MKENSGGCSRLRPRDRMKRTDAMMKTSPPDSALEPYSVSESQPWEWRLVIGSIVCMSFAIYQMVTADTMRYEVLTHGAIVAVLIVVLTVFFLLRARRRRS